MWSFTSLSPSHILSKHRNITLLSINLYTISNSKICQQHFPPLFIYHIRTHTASPLSFHHNIHTTRRFKTEILILTLCFTSLRKIDLQKKMTNTWHLSTTFFLSILWSMHPHHPKKNKLRTTPLNFKLSIYHLLCNPRSLTPYPTQFNIYRTSPHPHPNFPPCWI